MYRVMYVPLDERTCNYKYPQILAQLSNNIKLVNLPKKYMGNYRQPAKLEEVWDWIKENIRECDYGIFSIDTLVYGNIINSRIHNRTKSECEKYLSNLKEIKEINPALKIHAFNLVQRVANYDNDSEEPSYWSEFGTRIWRYSYLKDKVERKDASTGEKEELAILDREIPDEYLNDFLNRRKVNKYVNMRCLDLIEQGVIDHLVIPKDDNAKYGLSAKDHRKIAEKIWSKQIMDKVMVYPGADEVGCVIFCRVFNLIKGYKPRVYIRYSSTLGQRVIPKYEDRPLHEGIKSQITALGGLVVTTPENADLLLAVNSPAQKTTEAFEQENRDIAYYSYKNTQELLNFIEYYNINYQNTITISDTAFCNGADNEFMYQVKTKGLINQISSYCGWNTSQNTVGLALSHGCICSYYDDFKKEPAKRELSRQYLLNHLIESWIYEGNILPEFLTYTNEDDINPYKLEDNKNKIRKILQAKINKKINSELNPYIKEKIKIKNLAFPWNRIFDIRFDVKGDINHEKNK